jgi:hypothetical protein
VIFSVSIKSSQGEFIKSFNLSPFLPTKASHSHFESKPLQLVINLIENWVLRIIIMLINTILFMYGTVYIGIDDYYYDNESQQKVINKCKILKSKIINLLSRD